MDMGRHGWLRLTPAYSYNLVKLLLADAEEGSIVFDPFAGTGTTGLVAAQQGLDARLSDINDFLIWLAQTKCNNYTQEDILLVDQQSVVCVEVAQSYTDERLFIPPMHRIDRWWDSRIIFDLARLKRAISDCCPVSITRDLLLVAFCRVMIMLSKVTFRHQSMSLRGESGPQNGSLELFPPSSEVFDRFLEETCKSRSSFGCGISLWKGHSYG